MCSFDHVKDGGRGGRRWVGAGVKGWVVGVVGKVFAGSHAAPRGQ